MDLFYDIWNLIVLIVIRALAVAIVFTLLLSRFWKGIDKRRALNLARIIIIIYGCTNILLTTISLIQADPDNHGVYATLIRALGDYQGTYLFMLLASTIFPLLLLFRRIGRNQYLLLATALIISFAYWIERYIIIVTGFHRDHTIGIFPWTYVYAIGEGFILALILVGIARARSYIAKRN